MSKHKMCKNQESKKTKRVHRRKRIKTMMAKLITKCIMIFHFMRNLLLEAILSWYWSDRKWCPSTNKDNAYLLKSATELAELIRTRKLSSYDLIKAYIDRINEINPILNAIIDGPFMEALDEAREIDKRLANGDYSSDELKAKPFLGVPFTTKDSIAVKGKLCTMGVLSRKNDKSTEDGESIRLMREAGAIIIATTSIPEVCGWQETRNNIIGQTNNPYDTRRTVGGSSGGEAALVSACGTTFGVGSDIGGSIRMPAFYCGIFGHKPSAGIINTRGCSFRSGNEPNTMVVVGPMCRYVDDMIAMFKVMGDPQKIQNLNLDQSVDVKKLKYYYIRNSGDIRCNSVSSDLQDSMTMVVKHFNDIAETAPTKIHLSGTEQSFKLWKFWMTKEPSDFNLLLGNGTRLNPIVELFRKIMGQSEFTWGAMYNLLDKILPSGNADKLREITRKMDEELTNILGDDGILLYHSTTYPAPYHSAPLFNVFNFSYWGLFNVLHVPVTQVPLGLNKNGLPLGIQVIATRNRDRDCLAVAKELERKFGGWVPPFPTR